MAFTCVKVDLDARNLEIIGIITNYYGTSPYLKSFMMQSLFCTDSSIEMVSYRPVPGMVVSFGVLVVIGFYYVVDQLNSDLRPPELVQFDRGGCYQKTKSAV